MDTLLSADHLRRELGEERFAAIVSSDNIAAVRELADNLLKGGMPTEITAGGDATEVSTSHTPHGFVRAGCFILCYNSFGK